MIHRITFEEILPIWKEKLWPNRKSAIEPVSTIKFMGGYDINLLNSVPTFLGYKVDEKIVGVNSGFKTGENEYRSRGIYVDPEFRKSNIAFEIMKELDNQAKIENCSIIWSMPRKSAIGFYLKCGYEQVSPWFEEGVEFGPNCYVKKYL